MGKELTGKHQCKEGKIIQPYSAKTQQRGRKLITEQILTELSVCTRRQREDV